MDQDCPFCGRVQAREYDQYYAGLHVVRFSPLNPVVEGHMLFVPTLHREHSDPDASIYAGLAARAAQFYGASRDSDFNIITSSGRAATQTVPHIHTHYVPRVPDDGLQLPWGG